ncbi:class I SAM-dependent methyltransferase [Streptomyces sp. M19]
MLEVGPGHGLLLALAAERQRGSVVGWDVSATSLVATRRALEAMGARSVRLVHRDLLRAGVDGSFDAVVASELLEHLDRPHEALERLHALLRPGGHLFLNIPVNSPPRTTSRCGAARRRSTPSPPVRVWNRCGPMDSR